MAKGKLRTILDENPTVAIIGTVVVLVASLAAIAYTVWPQPAIQPVDVYFYDVDANQLFTASNNDLPPIKAPSGGMGVRAYVFACNDCDDPDDRFVAWLEMYTPEYKQALRNPRPVTPESDEPMIELGSVMEQGQLVRAPESPGWVSHASQQGLAVMEKVQEQCEGGSPPNNCFP